MSFVLLFLAGGAAWAANPRDQAKKHYSAGEARWKAGDYRGAIVEFEAADSLAPSPVLAYNIALCHDKLGNGAEALRHYRDYLSRWPEAPNRKEVEDRVAALSTAEPELKTPRVAQPTPEATPAPPGQPFDGAFANRVPGPGGDAEAAPASPGQPGAPQPGAPAPAPEPARKATPFYAQWWFWVIVGVGVAITIDVAINSSKDSSVDFNRTTPPGNAGLTVVRF
jgi:iron complex outermembrane receptor protein